MAGPSNAQRFAKMWEQHAARVQAYVAQHVGVDDAQEVVSETFLVAWRRLADVPGDPLPWLLVVARNTIANHRRSTYRGRVLEVELSRVAAMIRTPDHRAGQAGGPRLGCAGWLPNEERVGMCGCLH